MNYLGLLVWYVYPLWYVLKCIKVRKEFVRKDLFGIIYLVCISAVTCTKVETILICNDFLELFIRYVD